jgi:hypothetical protein
MLINLYTRYKGGVGAGVGEGVEFLVGDDFFRFLDFTPCTG